MATDAKHKKPNICLIAGSAFLVILICASLFDVLRGVAESGYTWQISRYIIIAAAGLATCALAAFLLFYKNIRLELCFIPAALLLSLLYACVLPPLSAPDELRHYVSAYRLSDAMMGIPTDDPYGRVLIRTKDWFAEDTTESIIAGVSEDGTVVAVDFEEGGTLPLGQTLTSATYESLYDYVKNGGREAYYDSLGDLAFSGHLPVQTTPVVYLAPALGITLARLMGLGTVALLVLGRLFNILLYCLVTAYAIKRIPFGKGVLFGVAILPMSLHLAASYSYDAPLMCGLWLFTAVCFDMAYGKEKVSIFDVALLAILMALVGPCKMVYAVMMGLCLLIPVKKFGGRGRWLLSTAAVLDAWAAAMLVVNAGTVASYATSTENYIDWAGEAGFTFSMVLHDPLSAVKMAFDTVLYQAGNWVSMMLGFNLGNSDPVLEVPFIVILLFGAGLVMMALRKPGDNMRFSTGNRIWIWCVCLALTGALLFSMLLAWTPIGSNVINGVQGRYFLPILPVFLLSLQNDTIVLTKNADRSILYLMCCANVYVLARIFGIVATRL